MCMKKFLVVREVRPDVFEKKVNEIMDEGKYEMKNSGADGQLGYWAYFVLKN